jgi:hypothetical protein
LAPPPVQGIGSASGFKMQIEDRDGLGTPQELASIPPPRLARIRAGMKLWD